MIGEHEPFFAGTGEHFCWDKQTFLLQLLTIGAATGASYGATSSDRSDMFLPARRWVLCLATEATYTASSPASVESMHGQGD